MSLEISTYPRNHHCNLYQKSVHHLQKFPSVLLLMMMMIRTLNIRSTSPIATTRYVWFISLIEDLFTNFSLGMACLSYKPLVSPT